MNSARNPDISRDVSHDMNTSRIRVGIDVGGTFTDAVAVDAATLELLGQVKVPTSHHHADGVAHGIVEALDRLMEQTGRAPADVSFLAHGTTQATNALLEGDVATVGLIGIGTGPSAVFTRRLASFGKLELAPGKRLPLLYAHVADPQDVSAVRRAVERLKDERLPGGGAQVLVASQPFSVDRPEGERAVLDAARPYGLPMTAAHEITSLYGLHKRTRTAVVNAAILPRMLATADLVDAAITKAGVTAPLMVMRCDGGVMALDEMRRRPLLTVLSGPAAGVAGALMQERVSEGVFLETGGTSTDISVVRRGKVAVRHATILGKTSYLNALDVRTVGVGGGSMVRIEARTGGDGRVLGVGPRSAHIAGLPYACFASPAELRGARVDTVRPMDGDPADYAVLDAAGGRFAVTMTCAANALGRVPEGDFAHCDPETARAAIAPLAAVLGTDVATAATRILDAGVARVRTVVDAMIRDYRLDKDTAVLVGGGGGAASVTPHLALGSGMEGRIARHNEVISPIGVALALVREQVERIVPGGASQEQILAVRAEAERAVVAQGAVAEGVEVEVTVDPQTSTVRAVATGATELRTQDRAHRADDTERLRAAAASLKADPTAVHVLAGTAAHTVYGTETRRRLRPARHAVRIVDMDGVVRHHAADAHVETTTVAGAPEVLARLVGESTSYGDGGVRAPALRLLLGSRIADLSGVLDPQPLLALAQSELRARAADEPVVAVLEVRS